MTIESRYDPHAALIVNDVQNDFADPKGALYVPGGGDIVPVLNREIARALRAGALVVYTQDWHPPNTPHFVTDGGMWPVHCVRGSWGAAMVPDLHVAGPILRKGTGGEDGYSGFTVQDPVTGKRSSTGLDELLRAHEVERVVISGLATDYCIKETALDALGGGFQTDVLEEAVRPIDRAPGDGDRALAEVVRSGGRIAHAHAGAHGTRGSPSTGDA
jgi:nicotinamidase/pyrazinamidase